MNQEYRDRVIRNLPNPFLCVKCGNEIKEVIFSGDDDLLCPLCEACLLVSSSARSEKFDPSEPWTAISSMLYHGREYAIVIQRNRPWFCSRVPDGTWVVECGVKTT